MKKALDKEKAEKVDAAKAKAKAKATTATPDQGSASLPADLASTAAVADKAAGTAASETTVTQASEAKSATEAAPVVQAGGAKRPVAALYGGLVTNHNQRISALFLGGGYPKMLTDAVAELKEELAKLTEPDWDEE